MNGRMYHQKMPLKGLALAHQLGAQEGRDGIVAGLFRRFGGSPAMELPGRRTGRPR